MQCTASDVFSFGVLVLEILTGQRNNSFRNGENVEDLLSSAWKHWREGTAINMIDPMLKDGTNSMREIWRCFHIGLLCVQENAGDRPTMANVALMLSSFSLSLPLPSEPAFFASIGFESDASLLKSVEFRSPVASYQSINQLAKTFPQSVEYIRGEIHQYHKLELVHTLHHFIFSMKLACCSLKMKYEIILVNFELEIE